jgi:HEAT repeat protein
MRPLIFLLLPTVLAAAGPSTVERLFDASLTSTQRATACFELRGNTSAETIGALARALQIPDLLSCAANNLRIAGAAEPLEEALRSADPAVRAAAARELGYFQKPELLEPLSKAAQDENALVAANAIAALSMYQSEAAIPFFAALARKGGMTGDMALDRLAQIDPRQALSVARELLSSAQIPDKLYAMRVIGANGDPSDLPALKKIAGAREETLSQRGRGFGFMPPINLSRAAKAAIASIESRNPL